MSSCVELDHVWLVSYFHETEAQALLRDQPTHELSYEQAAYFADKPVAGVDGRRPFVIRGVTLASSLLNACEGEGFVLVHTDALGHRAVPMEKQPLVVLLTTTPRDLYVECSMAE